MERLPMAPSKFLIASPSVGHSHSSVGLRCVDGLIPEYGQLVFSRAARVWSCECYRYRSRIARFKYGPKFKT